jgi:hypothetical protein
MERQDELELEYQLLEKKTNQDIINLWNNVMIPYLNDIDKKQILHHITFDQFYDFLVNNSPVFENL